MKYLYTIGIIGTLVLVVVVLFIRMNDSDTASEPFNATPDRDIEEQIVTPLTPQPLLEGSTLTVQASSGLEFQIANPAEKTVGFSPGLGMYQFSGSQQSEPKPYSVLFNANNSSFAISLDSEPFEVARSRASYDLLQILEITQQQACSLNVYVSVTADQDPDIAGENLGLVYCD